MAINLSPMAVTMVIINQAVRDTIMPTLRVHQHLATDMYTGLITHGSSYYTLSLCASACGIQETLRFTQTHTLAN